MGIAEFFGTLVKNDITSTSIKNNYSDRSEVNHFMLDFNSIIHVASQLILSEVNAFMTSVLKTIAQKRSIKNPVLSERFEYYGMMDIQNKITTINTVIELFTEHFDDQYMDKLIITEVINKVLYLVRTYCQPTKIKTLMLAIDGVPSKGKMVEQKQRRYLSAIVEEYKKCLLKKYTTYLKDLGDSIYESKKYQIRWTRNKITPGTAFMHKLVGYLRSEKIQSKLKKNRSQMSIIISDQYEVGEGEKKIVNYINKHLSNTSDTVYVYSPDADMILLCILLPVKNVFMLRYNQQEYYYDLIDINELKKNITYYLSINPDYKLSNFDVDSVNRDIVCMNTLFGNDFVPKIETLNVKKGFQNILDAYLAALSSKPKLEYLVVKSNGQFKLNYRMLRLIFKNLLPMEADYIKNNVLYNQYQSAGIMKNIFPTMNIYSETIVGIYTDFKRTYDNLKQAIRNNSNTSYFENNNDFMYTLKRAVNVSIDGQTVNTSYVTNKQMIKILRDTYYKTKDFPRLIINLNTKSISSEDPYHANQMKKNNITNDFDVENYKFDRMIDEYYTKFNAQPIELDENNIDAYYQEYFDIKLYYNKKFTTDASDLMHDYIEGLLWVFDYYFNDPSYINIWYYPHERSPLMTHIYEFLSNMSDNAIETMHNNLSVYRDIKLSNYFNPIEQLIYVSPLTTDIINLLPSNYREYLIDNKSNGFFRSFFINIKDIVKRLWREPISSDLDCRGIPFFNKCFVKPIIKVDHETDKLFLKTIRKVQKSETSNRRSKCSEPKF